MKNFDKTVIVVSFLCVLLLSILTPINLMATSSSYYVTQFKVTDIYPDKNEYTSIPYVDGKYDQTAYFTQEQTNRIAEHISGFLSGKVKNFDLRLDSVLINGENTDNVKIFSDTAITHMQDVKTVFEVAKIILYFTLVLFVFCIVYLYKFRQKIKSIIFKYSSKTLVILLTVVCLFLLFVFIKSFFNYGVDFSIDNYFMDMWYYMHHIFFPFDSSKFSGSFFNDKLTYMLTLDFFINSIIIVLSSTTLTVLLWLFFARKYSKNKNRTSK